MVSFISKKIEEESNLGSLLKIAREKRGISLDMISSIIKIDAKYLKAFEENDFASLPEGIYRDKFLKKYAEFLEVEGKSMLLFPISEPQRVQGELYKCEIGKASIIKKIKNFLLNPKVIRNAIILVLVFTGVAYLYFMGYNIVSPPKLVITSPYDDFVTEEFVVDIKGETEKNATVFINDKEIFCIQKGNFNETIDLKKGINIVKISAKKKYGKENVVYRKVLVTDSNEIGLK
ncbi:MAG: helix-turn-helix domain-containing protein [bacterium]